MKHLFHGKSLTFLTIATFLVGGFFIATGGANAADTVASQVDHYTVSGDKGSEVSGFSRSLEPMTVTSGGGTISQTTNDGTVTASISATNTYSDSGFYTSTMKLGDIKSVSITGSGPYGVNIWLDTNTGNDIGNNGNFFAWTNPTTWSGYDGDKSLLGPSSNETLNINDESQFNGIIGSGSYVPHTLAELKQTYSDTKIAFWVGTTLGSGGTQSATISTFDVIKNLITLTPITGAVTVIQGADLVPSTSTLTSNYDATGLKTIVSLKKDDTPINFNAVFNTFNLATKVGETENGPYDMNGAYSSFQYGPTGGYSVTAGIDQVTTNTGKLLAAAPVGTYTIVTEVKAGEVVMASSTYAITVPAPAPIRISTSSQLVNAIKNQADDQTWIIEAGIYDLPIGTETIEGQTGWYFPITANNLTITGEGNPIITSTSNSVDGNWSTQNFITVFGDNVKISGITLKSKEETNKVIEVIGNNFTLDNATIAPNSDTSKFAGSIYFSNPGKTATISNTVLNYGRISLSGAAGATINLNKVDINFAGAADEDAYWAYWQNNIKATVNATDLKVTMSTAMVNNLQAAIDMLPSGTTVELAAETYNLDSQIRITKGLTITGAGDSTIITASSTPWTNTTGEKGHAPLITIIGVSDPVVLQNFKVTGAANITMDPCTSSSCTDYGHGINVVNSSNVALNNITSVSNAAAGLVINSSTVTANNLNTSGNGWYGVNVDKTGANFALAGNGVITDTKQIFSENPSIVIVSAIGYTPYSVTGGTLWSNHLKAITNFTVLNQTGDTIIDQENHTIKITVPFGTDVTSLVPTFITTGDSVKIGTTTQTSATTPNNFTNPVTYTATAIDTTTQDYIVTVEIAPKMLKSITITTPASKLSYTVGDALDISGLVVTGTYSDNSTTTEAITTSNIGGFNSSVLATGQVLTITIGGKTAIYTVNIVAAYTPTPTPTPSYGGGGGGILSVSPCSDVTYGEWKTAINGIQYRDILNQTPNSCALTATQQSGRSRIVLLNNGTVNPETPANNNSTTTKQVLGVKVYADGTLLRGTNNRIYVVKGNTLQYIPNLKELAKYHGPILKVSDEVIASFSQTAVLGVKKYADGTLLKAKGDVKIYFIKNGKKVHIKSLAELKQHKGKTLTVEASELNNY